MKGISKRLKQYNEQRIPEMMIHKYRYMRQNLYRFFRGSCTLFYEDLAASGNKFKSPTAWICGDLHLENFGSYKGNNGLVYFDLNDFDESVLAPAAWEPVRLMTSIYIAFASLRIAENKADHMVKLYLRAYRETLATGKAEYVETATATGIVCDFLSKVGKRSPQTIFRKRTEDYKKLTLKHPKHLPLDKQKKKELRDHITSWLKEDGKSPYNYVVTDSVFRIAGTSSIGLQRYAILLQSSNKTGDKYMLIDMKESIEASIAPFVPVKQPKWEACADRIYFAQNIMQNRLPQLLSTTKFNGKSFVIQEMQSTKDNIDFNLIKHRYRDMCEVIRTMGILTASAQLRSAGRKGAAGVEDLMAFANETDIATDMLKYAKSYASKVKKYFKDYREDYKSGVFTKQPVEPSGILLASA